MNPNTIRRHQRFLSRQPVDRPPIGSWLFPFFIDRQFPELAATLKPGRIYPEDIQVEPFLRDVECLADAYADLNDDYPFSVGSFYAVPWMEAIMGCPIYFSGGGLWTKPCIADWDTYSVAPPNLENNRWFQKLLELLDALARSARGRYFCSPTLMRGVADICAAMRGASALPVDVLECADHVRRLADICADVWIEAAKTQLQLIPDSENGYVIGGGCMRYWAPAKGVWLQDDSIELLSPAAYRRVFLPHVRQIADEFTLAFHLHGKVVWPVEILLDVDGIDVLQLSSDGDFESVLRAWRTIQARKPCIAFVQVAQNERMAWERILDELSPEGLSLQTFSPTLDDARTKRDLVCGRAKSC